MNKYRADIDGLRAMAILSVVFYHAFPQFIRGGFVGVDIFFVISGYLITNIIFKDLDTNNFSIYNFYARRIKRILPALILVVSVCFVIGWFILTASEYVHLGLHARSSALFITNFILAKEENNYFDIASHAKPLMHLWSLAIEEQFYIIWPLLLYFVRHKKINFISISIAIIFISFFWSLAVLKINPVHAFYWAHLRSWELASGALCGYLSSHRCEITERLKLSINHLFNLVIYSNPSAYQETTLRNAASIAGFAMNIYAIFAFNDTVAFPGWYAAVPVIGTMLLLVSGESAWVNNKLLARKACVWVGLISYPLYLWHWPLLSFAYIIEGHVINNKLKLLILLISLILSWITYRFIERPIRSAKDKKFIVATLFIILLVAGAFGHIIIKSGGFGFRSASLGQDIRVPPLEYKKLDSLPTKCEKFLGDLDKAKKSCITNSLKPKFFVIGDSHALNFTASAILESKFDLLAFIQYGNYPFENYFVDPVTKVLKLGNGDFSINEYASKVIEFYSSIEYVIVAVSGVGIDEKNSTFNSMFVEGYVELLNFLMSKGKKVIFVIDFPSLDFDPKACQERSVRISSNKKTFDCLVSRSKTDAAQKTYRKLVTEIQQRVPSLLVYDPIAVFCNGVSCYGKLDGAILYYDNSHLNLDGARLLVEDFNKWFLSEINKKF